MITTVLFLNSNAFPMFSSAFIKTIFDPPLLVAIFIIWLVGALLFSTFISYLSTQDAVQRRKLNHIRSKNFYLLFGYVSLGRVNCCLPEHLYSSPKEETEGADTLLLLLTLGLLSSKTIYITLSDAVCCPLIITKP